MAEVRRVCAGMSPRLYASPQGLIAAADGATAPDGGCSSPTVFGNERAERQRLVEENQRLRRTLRSSSRSYVLGGRPVTVKPVAGAGFRSHRHRAAASADELKRNGSPSASNVHTRLGRGWRSAEVDPRTGQLGRPASSDMQRLFAHSSAIEPGRDPGLRPLPCLSPPAPPSASPSPTDLDGLLVARRALLDRPGFAGNPHAGERPWQERAEKLEKMVRVGGHTRPRAQQLLGHGRWHGL